MLCNINSIKEIKTSFVEKIFNKLNIESKI